MGYETSLIPVRDTQHVCRAALAMARPTALSKIKQVFGMFLFLRFPYIFLFFWHHFYFVVSSHHPCDSNLFIDLLQGVPLFWHDFILRPKSKKTCLILDKAVLMMRTLTLHSCDTSVIVSPDSSPCSCGGGRCVRHCSFMLNKRLP